MRMSRELRNDGRKIQTVLKYNNGQGAAVYHPDGLCPCLCSGDLSHNGLKIMEKQDIIDKNFSRVDDKKFVTTDRERENCYAVTTRPRGMPLHKKQDNYVLEENIPMLRHNDNMD